MDWTLGTTLLRLGLMITTMLAAYHILYSFKNLVEALLLIVLRNC